MSSDFQRVSTDRPVRTAHVRPHFQSSVNVLTVTVRLDPPDSVVIAVCGDVDASTCPLLRDRLFDQVRSPWPTLVVDLTEVSFFGAAGITVLLAVKEAAETAGVRMFLVARARVVLRPLAITGMDRLFEISPDITHARLRRDDVAARVTGGPIP